MKHLREKTSESVKKASELVNSNEIISDYDFHVQLIVEEKALDFEKDKPLKTVPA